MSLPEGSRGGRPRTALPAPLTLVVVSLFVLMAFETGQAIRDRSALTEVMRTQQPSIEQSAKLRQQLQTLAGKTAELAAAGDPGAQAVVAQMKAQGIALSVPKK
jgi:TolA-binding protein